MKFEESVECQAVKGYLDVYVTTRETSRCGLP